MGNISSLLDPRDRRGVIVPENYVEPEFPSLYLPSLYNTEQERGVFLYEAEGIWRFTFYWTLLLLGGTFFICALLASFSLILSLYVFRDDPAKPTKSAGKVDNGDEIEMTSEAGGSRSTKGVRSRLRYKKPPLWPILVLPIVMAAIAAAVAAVSGTVVGFALAAVYSAGGFTMSTWVPFLWGLIQVIILILSSYSTLTSIL